jgi:hypothetical protein
MAAPLRITRPPMVKAAMRKGGPAQEKPTPIQSYMERLVKLIPAEVVGLYLVGQGIIPPVEKVAIVVWSIVCLVLVVLVRAKTTGDRVNSISSPVERSCRFDDLLCHLGIHYAGAVSGLPRGHPVRRLACCPGLDLCRAVSLPRVINSESSFVGN